MCNLYFGSGVLKKDPDVLAVDPKMVFNLYNNYLLRSVFLYFCTFGIKIDHCEAGVVLWWRFAFPNSRLNRGSLKPEKKRADAGSRKPSCNRINQFARFSKKIRNFFGSKFKTGALKIFFSSFEQKMASYIFILFWEDFGDCGTRTIKFIYLLSQRRNHDLRLKWHKPKPQLRPKSCWKIICNFAYRLSCA